MTNHDLIVSEANLRLKEKIKAINLITSQTISTQNKKSLYYIAEGSNIIAYVLIVKQFTQIHRLNLN